MSYRPIFLVILLLTIIFYLPIFLNPNLVLDRGNDLQEFFWPIFYFTKQQILNNHPLPLWNNLFLSGAPLLPDPQSPLFYLPNIIFLILPINQAFIASFMLHAYFGGLGAYLAAKKGFGFSKGASLLVALLYLTLPKTAGFIETGHFGLVTSAMWLPFLLLASIKLRKSPSFGWSILLSVSLAGLFFTHMTTFMYAGLLTAIYLFSISLYSLARMHSFKTSLLSIMAFLGAFGLCAVTLLPLLEWLPQTTRFLLIEERDVYPKWNSKIEFTKAVYPHILGNRQFINELDSEKWLALGFFLSILAFIGFLQLQNKWKFGVITSVLSISLIALNNASPIYTLLLSFDWYVLGRVSTRIWFVLTMILVLLAGLGFDTLQKKGLGKIGLLISILAISELSLVSWLRLQKPILPQMDFPIAIFEYLNNDPTQFRVFCVVRCLSQKAVAEYNIETIEGYNTLQQRNYYEEFIQLSQVYWDKYTLALPPFEIYMFREIQPYSPELADYNVKYIISPHKLKDNNLVLNKQIGRYLIYENTIVRSRAYFSNGKPAPILDYSPNQIKIDTSSNETNQLIISEVYSSGWRANLNGNKSVMVEQTPNKLRKIELEKDTKFVNLYYQPISYQIGKIITFITVLILLALVTILAKRKKYRIV